MPRPPYLLDLNSDGASSVLTLGKELPRLCSRSHHILLSTLKEWKVQVDEEVVIILGKVHTLTYKACFLQRLMGK